MGTMLQQQHLTAADFGGPALEGCNENLNQTRPDVVLGIHRAYFEAGADMVETNTFGATGLVLAEYHLEDQAADLNRRAAELARQAAAEFTTAARPRFVAGSMGPTTKAITITGGVTFPKLRDHYYEQARALVEGGADVLLLETCQDTRNVKAGLLAIRRLMRERGENIPVMVSGTIEPMGTMLAGQTADAFYASVAHADLLSIGLNCATGPEFMTDHVRTLSDMAATLVSCYPNAGLPNEEGRYLETPESLAAQLERFVENGWINMLGGCCGTTAEHIRAMAQMAEGKKPRIVPAPSRRAYYSGIELVEAEESNRPLIVGERTNVIGSRLFKRMVAEEKWEEATEIARWQVKNGAHMVDVCLQSTDRDELGDIPVFYEKLIRKIKAPVMIDTTDPRAVELALTYCQGKSIINSINLEDGEEKFERVGPRSARIRRGADRRHYRRGQAAGAGLHPRTQAGRGRANLPAAHGEVRRAARGHHHRPAGVPVRHRRRQLHRRRCRNHRGRAAGEGEAAAREDRARRVEHLLRPARRGARGSQLRLPLLRNEGGARSRDCQRGKAGALRVDPGGGAAPRRAPAVQHAARGRLRGPAHGARRLARADRLAEGRHQPAPHRRYQRAFPHGGQEDQSQARGPATGSAPGELHHRGLEGRARRRPRPQAGRGRRAARYDQRAAHGGHGRSRAGCSTTTS